METRLSGSRFHHSFGLGVAEEQESNRIIVGALRGHPIFAFTKRSLVKVAQLSGVRDSQRGAATECRPYNLRNNRRLILTYLFSQLEQLPRLLNQRRQHFFDVPFPAVLQIPLNINSQRRALRARA